MKILLVDDESGFLDYTARRLRARGITVITAMSGQEALAKVREEDIDVVVLDILMPGMDGVEALKAIKEEKPSVQVVMLTGHGTTESADRGKEHGALFYLLKPADFGSLLDAIEQAYEMGADGSDEDQTPSGSRS